MKQLYNEKQIYSFWLYALKTLKVDLQTAVKYKTLEREKAYNLFLRKCKDRHHDFKAGYIFNPTTKLYYWDHNNE